jgi:hypothetical protein
VLSFISSFLNGLFIVVWKSISNDYDLIHIIYCVNMMICHFYCLFYAYAAVSIDTLQKIQEISGLAFERGGLE